MLSRVAECTEFRDYCGKDLCGCVNVAWRKLAPRRYCSSQVAVPHRRFGVAIARLGSQPEPRAVRSAAIKPTNNQHTARSRPRRRP